MWWPKPRARRSTSRRPLKNRSPAFTTGCTNSRSTNSSGESALVSSSSRPSAEPSSFRARSAGGTGGLRLSGTRIWSTIGRKRSRHAASVRASRGLTESNDARVLSKSVHHSSVRPSRSTSATFSSGSM